MRIALVATSYPATPGDPSGHFVRAHARALVALGHEVHVVAPRPVSDEGLVAHAAGGDALFAWPGAAARAREAPARLLAAPGFAARASRLLARLSPDRIVAHWMLPSALPIALAASARNHPDLQVVCHGADVRLLLSLPRAARDAVVLAVCSRASRVQLVAGSLFEALSGSLGPRARAALEAVAVIEPPLVEVSLSLPPPAAPAEYLLCAGRLVADKRVELAIGAVARLASCPPLFVAGDGPHRKSLEAMAARVAPGRVYFLGQVPRPEGLGWIKGARALIHPSAVEASPTVVLEALALGVPVVACGAGDVARWAEQRPAIVLCSPEPRSIADALARLLAAPADQGGQSDGGAATSVA